MYTCKCIEMYTCKCIEMYTCKCIEMYTCMHACAHTHTQTQSHSKHTMWAFITYIHNHTLIGYPTHTYVFHSRCLSNQAGRCRLHPYAHSQPHWHIGTCVCSQRRRSPLGTLFQCQGRDREKELREKVKHFSLLVTLLLNSVRQRRTQPS